MSGILTAKLLDTMLQPANQCAICRIVSKILHIYRFSRQNKAGLHTGDSLHNDLAAGSLPSLGYGVLKWYCIDQFGYLQASFRQ